jgi:site-specific recombinase XerD
MAASEDDLGGWEDFVLDRVSAATRINYVVALRVFYRWAIEDGRLEADPSTKLTTPKSQPRLPKPLPRRRRCSGRGHCLEVGTG